MPSFGSLFSAIGRVLPGFYEGERQAIQDNWKDLENYNNVQSGQLDNAFKYATFEPRLNNVWYNAAVNELNARRNRMDYDVYSAGQQGRLDREATAGAYMGQLTAQEIATMMAQLKRAAQGAPMGGFPGGTTLGAIDPNTGMPIDPQYGTGKPSGI